ncbi:sodium-dependent phosphate cotransporter [Algoriphagus aquaeductus]|jgi:solute carrier family 34 (sodium-dependent phosphate cotransporter)|uniref:Sodium-dependent phosphate cotransporter n=2 Tax=Cyclobacteriaceae TaxID=563798 RepID=A0A326RWV2_9BACT|nr:Na/Pi symporter [Algoriphagus aquaeductus]PZV86142.1 sodium-dependent phosphate cotransporter [Algoriphagus aquaeductus]
MLPFQNPLSANHRNTPMESLEEQKPSSFGKYLKYVQVFLALLLFIFAIDLLTVAMGSINSGAALEILQATKNPFISLFIGLLVTALIQSSSTVTASVVAIVASGNLTLQQAVPIVLGANIGTTLTSTLVSLSYIMNKKEFRRALSAGISHDVFNILSVIILFPMELYFGFLSGLAEKIAGLFASDNAFEGPLVYNRIFTRTATDWIVDQINIPFLTMILSVFLVFLAIKVLSTAMYKSFVKDSFEDINKLIFRKTGLAFFYGIFFTAAVQSSTVTTSLVVPLVANKKVTLAKAFPFIIGANIGTTITAVIASIYKSEAAIALAIVHILFNSIGALIFLPFPEIRKIPVLIANYMGKTSLQNRVFGFAYILLTFFIIPFLLIYLSKD